jgi:outer membrane lipoprotein-sorting protein
MAKGVCLAAGLIFAGILSSPGPCWAWGDNWEAIRAAAKDIRGLEAGFIQEKHLPILAKPLVSEGRLLYQAPGALRWEYHAPVQNVLLMREGDAERYVLTGG